MRAWHERIVDGKCLAYSAALYPSMRCCIVVSVCALRRVCLRVCECRACRRLPVLVLMNHLLCVLAARSAASLEPKRCECSI
eukprot:6186870-Pleurochrysis_carterae.AAC.1